MFEIRKYSAGFIFSYLCGFTSKYISRIEDRSKKVLERLSFWSLTSIILCATSTSFLIYKSKGNLSLAICSFLFLILLLISLQALLITSSCIELDIDPTIINKWKPAKFRSFIFILLGLLFSQPLVFTAEAMLNDLNNNVSVTKLNIQEDSVKERFIHYESEKNLELLQKKIYLSLFDPDAPDFTSQYVKKALIINNVHKNKNPTSLIKTLGDMGFSVFELHDLNISNFEFELKKYRDKLNSGDISIIIYNGKFISTNNKNYLLPTDYSSNIDEAVDLDNLVSSINKKRLLMSSFVLYLQQNSIQSPQKGVNNFKFPDGNLALINLTDSNINENNSFALILGKNISNHDDIQNIFHKIYQDLLAATNFNKQSIKLINKLNLPIFLNGKPDFHNIKYSQSEIINILSKKELCSDFSAGDNKIISNCLKAEIKILENEKVFLNDIMVQDIKNIEKVKKNKLLKPSLVFNYFGDLWNHKLKTIFYSLIAMFFISGGFIFRDHYFDSINAYEYQNFRNNRLDVLLNFRVYRNKTQLIRKFIKPIGEFFYFSKLHHPLNEFKIKEPKINRNASAIDDFYIALKKLSKVPKSATN